MSGLLAALPRNPVPTFGHDFAVNAPSDHSRLPGWALRGHLSVSVGHPGRARSSRSDERTRQSYAAERHAVTVCTSTMRCCFNRSPRKLIMLLCRGSSTWQAAQDYRYAGQRVNRTPQLSRTMNRRASPRNMAMKRRVFSHEATSPFSMTFTFSPPEMRS